MIKKDKRHLVPQVHKITNAPLILKVWAVFYFIWANLIIGLFSGFFEGASTFLTSKLPLATLGTI